MTTLFAHTELHEGFRITLSVRDDDCPVDYEASPMGTPPQMFCVSASRHGVQLAESYLSGCYYEKPSDFLHVEYYPQMRDEVVKRSRAMIEKLAFQEV